MFNRFATLVVNESGICAHQQGAINNLLIKPLARVKFL